MSLQHDLHFHVGGVAFSSFFERLDPFKFAAAVPAGAAVTTNACAARSISLDRKQAALFGIAIRSVTLFFTGRCCAIPMNYLDKVEHLSFGQCVRGAWRDAWQSIMNRPAARGLALACVAVYAIRVLVQLTFAAEMAFDGGTGPFVSLFQSAVSIILSVQAIRYVVLGADEARASGLLDRGFWRYLRLYAMVLLVLFIALMGSLLWLYMVVHDSVYRQVWTVLAALFAATVFVYVHTRLTLLFCHVSIGGSMRWRAAWRDTRGRFWRFVAVQFVVALPVIAVLLVSLLLVSISGSAGGTSEVWLIEFVAPLASLAMSVQAASCSAWLYRRYANEIRE